MPCWCCGRWLRVRHDAVQAVEGAEVPRQVVMGQAFGHVSEKPKAEREPDVILPGARHEAAVVIFQVLLLSGERLTELRMSPYCTGTTLRDEVARHLPYGVRVKELLHGESGQAVDTSGTIAELGLQGGGDLVVATKKSAFVARDAGSEAVNGFYFQAEDTMNNVPCFTNDAGTVLFRDISPARRTCWSFSRGGAGIHHFYRVASQSTRPPTEGWEVDENCFGVLPVPRLAAVDDAFDDSASDVEEGTCSRKTSSTQSLESTSSQMEPDQSMELEFLHLSGESMARLSVGGRWTGRDVRAAIQKQLPEGLGVHRLVLEGGKIFEHGATVKSLGLFDSSQLHVVIRECDYLVSDAVPEVVNGCYFRERRRFNGAPCYTNEAGTLLFRYRFRNGAFFWYFSQKGQDLDKSEGDYFRVKTTVPLPPEHGWTASKCPLGCAGHLPSVVRRCQDECEEGGEEQDYDDVTDDDETSLDDEAALEDEVLGHITAGL